MAPPDAGTSNTIDVDGPGMDKVATTLDDVHSRDLRPLLTSIGKTYELGTPFGTESISPALRETRTKHCNCLVGAAESINKVMLTADMLVAAIRYVRQNYTNADLAAASNADAINSILGNALAQAQTNTAVSTAPSAEPSHDAEG